MLVGRRMDSEVSRICEALAILTGYLLEYRGRYVKTSRLLRDGWLGLAGLK